jgi:hypothetical protein
MIVSFTTFNHDQEESPMKTRAIIISVIALLCVSMTACGKGTEKPVNMLTTENTVAETTETVTETETPAAVDPRVRDIAGVWFEDGEKVLDPRTLTVNVDGTYVLDYKGGGFINGTVAVETEEHPDGTETIWYSFYESDGNLWTGFQRTEEQPQNDLYSGQDGEQHFLRAASGNATETSESTSAVTAAVGNSTTVAAKTTTTAAKATTTTKSTGITAPAMPTETTNKYGFIPEKEVPQTSVSVKQFEGLWNNPRNPIRSITFYDCDYLSGKFTMQNSDSSLTEGIIRLEYKPYSDGTQEGFYNLYDKNGVLLFSISTNTDIPFESFVSTDGINSYVRASQDEMGPPLSNDYIGVWSAGRIYITIEKSGDGYEASVKWSSSAAESTYWTYSCVFTGEYLDSTNGRCVTSVYDEDGNESSTVEYTNGCAHFRINENGNLIWEELRDYRVGSDTEFMRLS